MQWLERGLKRQDMFLEELTLITGLTQRFLGNSESQVANTETWNGSAWTEVNELNTARSTGGGFGTQTSAIMATGYTPSFITNTESWDGQVGLKLEI